MTVLQSNCQGGIVFSNIVTTVSPTYAQEVLTTEVWVMYFLPYQNIIIHNPINEASTRWQV